VGGVQYEAAGQEEGFTLPKGRKKAWLRVVRKKAWLEL
jgi:hypothetical protein